MKKKICRLNSKKKELKNEIMKKIFKVIFYLKESDFKKVINDFEHKEFFEKKTEEDKWVLCSVCKSRITKKNEKIEVSGKHIHTFVNPTGVYYNIRCFRTAEGVSIFSGSTDNFTWFPGYSWSVVVCSNCQVHNGWLYDSGKNSFYGLIDNKIIIN